MKDILIPMKRTLIACFGALCLTAHAWAEGEKLEVTSEPPGALVVVNRVVRGTTPITITELTPGTHELRVSHGEDYRPYQVELTIEEGQTEQCHVQLNPRSSTSLKLGVKAFKEGKLKEAEVSLNRALTDTPIQPEGYYWLAVIARDRDDISVALEQFRKYAQYFPDRSDIHLELADLHFRKKDLSSALTSYKLAMLNDKRYKGSLDTVGASTWDKIKAAGEPTEPLDQLRLAFLLEQKGRIPEAVTWARTAVAGAFPNYPRRPLR